MEGRAGPGRAEGPSSAGADREPLSGSGKGRAPRSGVGFQKRRAPPRPVGLPAVGPLGPRVRHVRSFPAGATGLATGPATGRATGPAPESARNGDGVARQKPQKCHRKYSTLAFIIFIPACARLRATRVNDNVTLLKNIKFTTRRLCVSLKLHTFVYVCGCVFFFPPFLCKVIHGLQKLRGAGLKLEPGRGGGVSPSRAS